jgi:hypothetical protein
MPEWFEYQTHTHALVQAVLNLGLENTKSYFEPGAPLHFVRRQLNVAPHQKVPFIATDMLEGLMTQLHHIVDSGSYKEFG